MDGWMLSIALLLALAINSRADILPSYSSPTQNDTNSLENTCKLFEFPCNNGTCISSSKYCNGHHDCIDKSDEPDGCTRKFIPI